MSSMKRSFINRKIAEARELILSTGYALPEFAFWTPQQFRENAGNYQEIFDTGLGWDITDWGMGDFDTYGFVLLTVRNGKFGDPRYPKPYAEKLCVCFAGQKGPWHYHKKKMEDSINFGFHSNRVQLYKLTPDGKMDEDSPVDVRVSGRSYQVKPGEIIEIKRGQSITMDPYIVHGGFSVEPTVTLEISTVNDDGGDNYYLTDGIGWDYDIIEDVPAEFLLSREY